MLALQTRQQLASTALSLVSQADQGVLRSVLIIGAAPTKQDGGALPRRFRLRVINPIGEASGTSIP